MIRVKKISIFGLIKHFLISKKKFLGYTRGKDVEVFEVNFPLFGADRRDKTIIHEIGHLEINENGTNDHINYDRVTKHGLRQDNWHSIQMRDWKYTENFRILV